MTKVVKNEVFKICKKVHSRNVEHIDFNYREWLLNNKLRSVDSAVRAIYVDLVCASLDRSLDMIGVFRLSGRPLDIKIISRLIKSDPRQVKRAVECLVKVGLCEYQHDGALWLSEIEQIRGVS